MGDPAGSATSRATRPLVDVVVRLGRRLGLQVIAEGVAEPAERAIVEAAGCRLGQGDLFGRAMPTERLEALLAAAFPAAPDQSRDSAAPWLDHRSASDLSSGRSTAATRPCSTMWDSLTQGVRCVRVVACRPSVRFEYLARRTLFVIEESAQAPCRPARGLFCCTKCRFASHHSSELSSPPANQSQPPASQRSTSHDRASEHRVLQDPTDTGNPRPPPRRRAARTGTDRPPRRIPRPSSAVDPGRGSRSHRHPDERCERARAVARGARRRRHLRHSGRRDPPGLRPAVRLDGAAHPGAARAGRRPRRDRLRAGHRPGRRLHGDERSGCDEPGHADRRRVHGLGRRSWRSPARWRAR